MINLKQLSLFLALLLGTVAPLFAAKVTVNGTADTFYYDKPIHILRYADQVSWKLEKIATSSVSADGKFSFAVDIDATQMVIVRSEGVSASMFLEPSSKYKVHLPRLPDDQAWSMAGNNVVAMIFSDLPINDINSLVSDLNICYDSFINDIYLELAYRRVNSKIDSFAVDVTEHSFHNVDNKYFDDYRFYLVASLVQMQNQLSNIKTGKKDLYDKFLKDRPILYDNVSYMSFFNSFHEQYFGVYISNFGSKILSYAINETPRYTLLMEALGRDDFLEDVQLREMVLVKALSEIFYSEKYSKDHILSLIDSVHVRSEFPENRKIAANMRHELTKLEEGFPAADFTLMDQNGNEVKLSELKGKFVYVGFYQSWCKPCLAEMILIEPMIEKYYKEVTFISISLDENKEEIDKLLKEHPEYKWTFLHGGDNKELAEMYGVRSLPSYFLIDTNGNFMQVPALRPMPDGTNVSIDETLHKIKMRMKDHSSGVLDRTNH